MHSRCFDILDDDPAPLAPPGACSALLACICRSLATSPFSLAQPQPVSYHAHDPWSACTPWRRLSRFCACRHRVMMHQSLRPAELAQGGQLGLLLSRNLSMSLGLEHQAPAAVEAAVAVAVRDLSRKANRSKRRAEGRIHPACSTASPGRSVKWCCRWRMFALTQGSTKDR